MLFQSYSKLQLIQNLLNQKAKITIICFALILLVKEEWKNINKNIDPKYSEESKDNHNHTPCIVLLDRQEGGEVLHHHHHHPAPTGENKPSVYCRGADGAGEAGLLNPGDLSRRSGGFSFQIVGSVLGAERAVPYVRTCCAETVEFWALRSFPSPLGPRAWVGAEDNWKQNQSHEVPKTVSLPS